MTLTDLKNNWEDTEIFHKTIHEHFIDEVNADLKLKEHRDWVEQNIFGFGERSFWWLWKILLDEVPKNARILEIGVFRGATLSVWKLMREDVEIFGITPLDTSGGVWESDYESDICKIHDTFGLPYPKIINGRSQQVVSLASIQGDYDIIYIDGDHSFEGALSDLTNYSLMVKNGGFLVIDDSNCEMHMPFGFFQGIQSVTDAKLEWLKTQTDFEFVASVVHISVFRRVK